MKTRILSYILLVLACFFALPSPISMLPPQPIRYVIVASLSILSLFMNYELTGVVFAIGILFLWFSEVFSSFFFIASFLGLIIYHSERRIDLWHLKLSAIPLTLVASSLLLRGIESPVLMILNCIGVSLISLNSIISLWFFPVSTIFLVVSVMVEHYGYVPLLISYFIGSCVPALIIILCALRSIPKAYKLVQMDHDLKYFFYAELVNASIYIIILVFGLIYLLLYEVDIYLILFSGMLLAYGFSGMCYFLYKAFTIAPELKLKPFRRSISTAFIVRRPLLLRIAERYANSIADMIVKAGVLENPLILVAKHMFCFITLLPLSIVFSISLSIIYPSTLGMIMSLMVLSTPLVIILWPYIVLPMKIGDRRRNVEEELPWFTLLAAALQRAGLSLYEAFKAVLEVDLLPAIKKEALILRKKVTVLGRDALTAMEELGNEHPSKVFRNFIHGYTSLLRTGGDVAGYLESRVREYLQMLSFKMKTYAERAVTFGEILIATFFIFTSAVVLGGIIGGADVEVIVYSYNFLIAPLLFTLMFSMIHYTQIKIRDRITANHVIAAIPVAIAATLPLLTNIPIVYAILLVLGALGFGYGIQYQLQLRKLRAIESAIEDFLRDIGEYKKIGINPARAIESLSRNRSYNPCFDHILRSVANQLSFMIPLSQVRVPTGSWLARMVFWILGKIEDSGGGSPQVIEMITNFFSDFNIARKHMRSTLRLYDILTLITPVLLITSMAMVIALSSLFTMPEELQGVPYQLPSMNVVDPLNVKFSIIISSTILAVLAGKVIDLTLKSMLRLLIVSTILGLSMIFVEPQLIELMKTIFAPPT